MPDVTPQSVAEESLDLRTKRARSIVRRLKKAYPDAGCPLNFSTPHQLLVATILSAQATDKAVNLVTPDLFRTYKTVKAFADVAQDELEVRVHSLGFFRNKAKSIRTASQKLLDDFGGEVPRTMEEMLTLPGVARKTANVVLGNAYGVAEGIVVDTHVIRLSGRMGLSGETDPVKIERDLMALIPKKGWIAFGHLVTTHGRRICIARRPRCEECPVEELCPKII